MSKILVECTQDVVHGPYNLVRGQTAMMDEHLAEHDLKPFVKRAEEKPAPVAIYDDPIDGILPVDQKSLGDSNENKMLGDFENKGEGDLGNDSGESADSPPSKQQNSSSSPVDQALPPTTVKQPAAGATKKRGGR